MPDLIIGEEPSFSGSLITAMLINRNRKIIFQPLLFNADNSEHKLVYPDDVFILAYFRNSDNHLIEKSLFTFDPNILTMKEFYFYGQEMKDLDWLYEEDFRRKDNFIVFFHEL